MIDSIKPYGLSDADRLSPQQLPQPAVPLKAFVSSIQRLNNKPRDRVVSVRLPSKMIEILEQIAIIFYREGIIEKPLVGHLIKWNMELLVKYAIEHDKILVEKELKYDALKKIQLSSKIAMAEVTQKLGLYKDINYENIEY